MIYIYNCTSISNTIVIFHNKTKCIMLYQYEYEYERKNNKTKNDIQKKL